MGSNNSVKAATQYVNQTLYIIRRVGCVLSEKFNKVGVGAAGDSAGVGSPGTGCTDAVGVINGGKACTSQDRKAFGWEGGCV
jgi:hypothetical protein